MRLLVGDSGPATGSGRSGEYQTRRGEELSWLTLLSGCRHGGYDETGGGHHYQDFPRHARACHFVTRLKRLHRRRLFIWEPVAANEPQRLASSQQSPSLDGSQPNQRRKPPAYIHVVAVWRNRPRLITGISRSCTLAYFFWLSHDRCMIPGRPTVLVANSNFFRKNVRNFSDHRPIGNFTTRICTNAGTIY